MDLYMLLCSFFFTVRNEVAKVMFLQASVCPRGGGGWGGGGVCLSACWDTPPRADTPGSRHPPEQTPLQSRHPLSRHPCRADTHPQEQTPPGVDTPQSRHPPGSRRPRADTPPGSRHPPRADNPPGSRHPPPPHPRNGHCCGRYASYWNALFFIHLFKNSIHHSLEKSY